MNFDRLHGVWLLIALALSGALFGGVMLVLTYYDYTMDRQQRMQHVNSVLTTMLIDIEDLFGHLQGYSGPTCDANHLKVLFQERQTSVFFEDIAVADGANIICSTAGGLTPWQDAFVEMEADFAGIMGGTVWTGAVLPWVGHIDTGYVIRRGKYALVLETKSAEPHAGGYQLETLFQSNRDLVHLFGVKDLYKIARAQKWYENWTMLSDCGAAPGYCVALNKPVQDVIKAHRPAPLVAVLLLVSIMALVFYSLNRWLAYHMSIPVRVSRSWNSGFYCAFQPIVNMETEEIENLEVLARFQDHLGTLSPGDFIPAVEAMHRTEEFTLKIVEMALTDLGQVAVDHPTVGLSINVFPEDLVPHKVVRLIETVKTYRPACHRGEITIEILESGQIEMTAMSKVMPLFQEAGILISLDDFGTGYSNMVTLQRLSLNKLKIDQSFVRDMMDESVKATLVPHMIGIGESLGLKVVAEGVEDPKQAEVLKTLGVDYAQGWLFGHPYDIGQLKDFLKNPKDK